MPVVRLVGLVIDQPGQPPTAGRANDPFEPLPAIVNEVLEPVAHLLCGGPALATGFALTVSVMSDVAVPQPSLVTVRRKVQDEATLPPEYTIGVVRLFGVVMLHPAHEPTDAQLTVPFEPLAALVKE